MSLGQGGDWHPHPRHGHLGTSLGNAIQSIPTPEPPTSPVPKPLLCKSVPFKAVSPEGAQQGSGIRRTFPQALTAPYQLWILGKWVRPAFCLRRCKMQTIPGQVHSPSSKPKGQMCFKVQNFSDVIKVIECLRIMVIPMVGLSSNTSIRTFRLKRINSLGQILPPNAFIGLSFPSTLAMK